MLIIMTKPIQPCWYFRQLSADLALQGPFGELNKGGIILGYKK